MNDRHWLHWLSRLLNCSHLRLSSLRSVKNLLRYVVLEHLPTYTGVLFVTQVSKHGEREYFVAWRINYRSFLRLCLLFCRLYYVSLVLALDHGGSLLMRRIVNSAEQVSGRSVSMAMNIRLIWSARRTTDAGGFSTTNITTSMTGFFQVCIIIIVI